jgi:hypothetical protein
VYDADAAFGWLLELEATGHNHVQDVGDGIRVATVLDPYGNVLGVIENRISRSTGIKSVLGIYYFIPPGICYASRVAEFRC